MTQENDRPFLERYGYAHKALQIESMDTALKNGLWNAFVQHVWDSNPAGPNVASMTSFCENLWGDHFKEKEDDLRRFEGRSFYRYNRDYLRTEFRNRFDGSNWYEVYDFLEFVGINCPSMSQSPFMEACNVTLERERAAYRFVGGRIAPITNDLEIETIDSAIEDREEPATHLRDALKQLSDRKTPNYRNSIKEAISAVESQARITMRDEKATLGPLLIKLERERGLPKPLKEAFSKLYGYTSGPSGIRHGLVSEGTEVGFDLAKFMLVACSAFVNFIAASAEET